MNRSDFSMPPNCLEGMKSFVGSENKIDGKFISQMYGVPHYSKNENQFMHNLYKRSHQWNMIRKNKLMLECVINERSLKQIENDEKF